MFLVVWCLESLELFGLDLIEVIYVEEQECMKQFYERDIGLETNEKIYDALEHVPSSLTSSFLLSSLEGGYQGDCLNVSC